MKKIIKKPKPKTEKVVEAEAEHPNDWNVRIAPGKKGFTVEWFTPYGKSWEPDPWFWKPFKTEALAIKAVSDKYGSRLKLYGMDGKRV